MSAGGNSDLAARTDSQAAALEETAASMEQLAATVRTNAERTHQGSDISGTAMATAKKGGTIMDKVVTTINDISQSSEKISDIVGIINGIASQTNLLALNAAIDAGKTMQEIIASVSEVTSIITDISSASAEQSTGISQVNDAITEMDEVTQRNAALVEQAASATGGLEQQGSKLMQGLAVFKLRNAQSRKPAAEPPAPAAPVAEKASRRKKMSEAEAA